MKQKIRSDKPVGLTSLWGSVPPPSWQCQDLHGFCYSHPSLISVSLFISSSKSKDIVCRFEWLVGQSVGVRAVQQSDVNESSSNQTLANNPCGIHLLIFGSDRSYLSYVCTRTSLSISQSHNSNSRLLLLNEQLNKTCQSG